MGGLWQSLSGYRIYLSPFLLLVNLPWLMKLLGSAFVTIKFLLEDVSFGREREFRESICQFLHFQMPTSQNSQYTKLPYFEVACPDLLQSYFGVLILLLLLRKLRLNKVKWFAKDHTESKQGLEQDCFNASVRETTLQATSRQANSQVRVTENDRNKNEKKGLDGNDLGFIEFIRK